MNQTKRMKYDAGFSLLETLVAIVVFALVITAIGSCLVMSHRINNRSEVLMQEQLKVSRAVEGIMASGIDASISETQLTQYYGAIYPDVMLSINRGTLQEKQAAFYTVTVQSRELAEDVNVTTYVRPVNTGTGEGGVQ